MLSGFSRPRGQAGGAVISGTRAGDGHPPRPGCRATGQQRRGGGLASGGIGRGAVEDARFPPAQGEAAGIVPRREGVAVRRLVLLAARPGVQVTERKRPPGPGGARRAVAVGVPSPAPDGPTAAAAVDLTPD